MKVHFSDFRITTSRLHDIIRVWIEKMSTTVNPAAMSAFNDIDASNKRVESGDSRLQLVESTAGSVEEDLP